MSLLAEIRKLPCPSGSRQYLTSIKKILQDFKDLIPVESEDDIYSNLAFLVELYLNCPSKLTAKRAMTSFFQGLGDSIQREFESQLCHQLKKCLNINFTQSEVSVSTRHCVDNINSLMENFKLGEKCLFRIFIDVVSFLIQAERYFLSGFGPDVPPVGLNEVMFNCHVTMQTINLVLQKTATECPQKINELSLMHQYLSNLMNLDIQIIHNDLFLLDCRCCCAMNVFLLLQLVLPGNSAASVIPSLLLPEIVIPCRSEYPAWLTDAQISKLLLDSAMPLTFLALTSGYIAMVSAPVLSHTLPDLNNLFYIDIVLPQLLHVGKSCEDTPSKTLYAKTVNLWTSRLLTVMEHSAVDHDDVLAAKMRGNSDTNCILLDYVWTHWEDHLDILRQSVKTVFENVLRLHTRACAQTDVDSTPFILFLLKKVLNVSWSSRGKFNALSSCVHHVGTKVLLDLRPSLPDEVLQQLQEQAVSCYAGDLYSSLFLSHRRETISLVNSSKSSGERSLEEALPLKSITENEKQQVIPSLPLSGEQQNVLMEIWIFPVIKAMHSSQRNWKQNIIEYLLPKLMKSDVHILDFMIGKMSSAKVNPADENLAYGAIIMCLRRARVIGLLSSRPESSSNEFWFGILPPAILKSALCSLNEQIRLDAFALLCENCKTTEAISTFEFEMLQFFIPSNVSNQSPAFRQTILSLLKKLFFRLKESMSLLKRLVLKKNSSSSSVCVKEYVSFLSWLTTFFLDNIYPGSTFARRVTSLACLTLMTSFFGSSKDGFSVPECLTEDYLQKLLNCLTDPFEDNKKEALNMLSIYTKTVSSIGSSDRLKRLLEIAFTLASSIRPQDCESAAYLFKLLLVQPTIYEILQDFPLFLKSDTFKLKLKEINASLVTSPILVPPETKPITSTCNTQHIASSIYLLNLLCLSLNDHIELARSSLVTAAANCPMYPTLHCIRYIMYDFNWNALTDSLLPMAKQFIDFLIHTCLDLAEVVSPVVQNSSPEGNVPTHALLNPESNVSNILHSLGSQENDASKARDEQQLRSLNDERDDEIDARQDSQATNLAQSVILSQILVEAMPEYLVVCCWRSIKEVSLTLGKLCLQIPIAKIVQVLTCDDSRSSHASSSPLICLDQVKTMGKYFTHQLLESIHRGAFELAYAGFQLMCQMLWSHQVPAFHTLPTQWLQQVMMDIKSPQSKLCATRRSAGVPFFIQAITSSEPAATGRKCFHGCIKELLVLAAGHGPVTEDAQIHALNILRTLYRDARLGEEVTPYVSEGLKAAILGFKSDLWVVRNSSTLLLSALMTRIFGVKRSKDESAMSRKNCQTGRIFFHTYPSLYPFLLNELESATASVSRRDVIHLHPSLYPILLVLGRLFPSVLEGSSTSLSLSAFIPYILKCASSPVYKTRIIAARALQPLAKRNQVTEIIEKLLNNFPSSVSGPISNSLLHGSLLQLYELMKLVIGFNNSLKERTLIVFLSKFLASSWLLSSENRCYATRQAALRLADVSLDVARSLNSAAEVLSENVRCLETCLMSSLSNSAPIDHQWMPFFYEFEKTKASFIMKHLLAFNSFKEDEHPQERTISGSDVKEQIEKDNEIKTLNLKREIVLDLLSSPFYEVRLETLNSMVITIETQSCSSFTKEGNTKESCSNDVVSCIKVDEIKADWTEMSDDINQIQVKSSIETKAVITDISANLFDSILTMAMEKENHHECIEMVFLLLAEIPDCTSLLHSSSHSDFHKVFTNLLQRIETEKRIQLKASMLRFSSRILPLIYDKITEENQEGLNQLLKWITMATSCSRSDANPDLQISVSICLMENVTLLLRDPQQKLGATSLLVWDIMAILLQADDLEVKDIVSSALAIAFGQHQDAFHPNYALHKLLEFLISSEGKLPFSKLFKCMVSWILTEGASEETESEDRLFERGEMNTYRDQTFFSHLVAEVLLQYLKRLENDSNSHNDDISRDKKELEDFMTVTTMKLIQKLEACGESFKMSDAFTNPGKYTDIYQATDIAQSLMQIFKECRGLGISLPTQCSSLEGQIVRIKGILHISSL